MAQIKSVAAIGGLELEIVADYKHFEDNKKPEFLAKFPHGKIPALEGSNGFNLTEGAAIARYRASSLPPNPRSLDVIGNDENHVFISYPCLNLLCRYNINSDIDSIVYSSRELTSSLQSQLFRQTLTSSAHLRRSKRLSNNGLISPNLRSPSQQQLLISCSMVSSCTTRLYVLPFPSMQISLSLLQIHNTLIERQVRALNTLEAHLLTRTFVVGERITLADINVAAAVFGAVRLTIDAETRLKLVNTIRHLETIINQPKLKDVFGEVEYVEKAVQYVPPKKEAKPAPAPTPAAPKEKKEKPKKEDEDEEDDGNLVPEEPKAKNPLDLLPKSSFNLEDWKRAYSNKDTRGPDGAIEWFYAKCVSDLACNLRFC